VAAARFVLAVRALLVDDTGSDLALLPGYPTAWRGGALQVHDLPTSRGRLSFAVRWHGYRPALLWQLDGDGAPLRAPGLDAGWSTDEPRGETLLSGSADELPSAPHPGQDFS
jgi:hypothetical protein